MKEFVSEEIVEIAKKHGFTNFSCICGGFPECICNDEDIRYTDLIEWIFIGRTKQELVTWLEFWYNTLIPELQDNEFILEGFVGMLLNWFQKKGYYLESETNIALQTYFIITNYNGLDDNIFWTDYYNSKQQARHEGIKQVFNLLKEKNL